MSELMIASTFPPEDFRSLNTEPVQAADWVPVSVYSQVFTSSESEACNNSSKT